MNIARLTRCLLILLSSLAGPAIAAAPQEDSPPAVTDLVTAHTQLRDDVKEVYGSFTLYRAESVRPEFISQPETEVTLPVLHQGTFWRHSERFRADFDSHSGEPRQTTRHAIAIDAETAFEFSAGAAAEDDSAVLRICDSATPEAQDIRRFAEMSLLERVDSLWSSGGVAFTDYLQRPDTEIVPNDEDPLHGGILILIHDDSGDIRFQLEDGTLKPIGYIRVETEMLTVERRVFSERRAHGLYPTRVVDLTTFQDGTGYTEVVDFDLAPLEPESPVSKPFSADSFRNPGSGYQVYRLMREGEELAERVEGPGTSNTSGLAVRDGSRSWFLWANTAVIAAIVLVILARRFRRK